MCWGLYRTYSCIWRLRSVDQDVSAGLQYFIIMLFFLHILDLYQKWQLLGFCYSSWPYCDSDNIKLYCPA